MSRIFTYKYDENEDPRMREVRRIFTFNCDEDEDSQDERGEEDLYL
jgi:hypothetical protein